MKRDGTGRPFTQMVIADDAPHANFEGLFQIETPQLMFDRRRIAHRRRVRSEALVRGDRHRAQRSKPLLQAISQSPFERDEFRVEIGRFDGTKAGFPNQL